jgi:hypothetical protein
MGTCGGAATTAQIGEDRRRKMIQLRIGGQVLHTLRHYLVLMISNSYKIKQNSFWKLTNGSR